MIWHCCIGVLAIYATGAFGAEVEVPPPILPPPPPVSQPIALPSEHVNLNKCATNVDHGKTDDSSSQPVLRYYWDQSTVLCRAFSWYGTVEGPDSNNFKTLEQCLTCRPSDPPACRFNDVKGILPPSPPAAKEPGVPAGELPPGCHTGACPDGYVCKRLWNGSPVCCNAEKEEQLDVVYDKKCPNGESAYFVGENPFIGDSCSSLICPTGFECQQDNPLVARCCTKELNVNKCQNKNVDNGTTTDGANSQPVLRYYWDQDTNLCRAFSWYGTKEDPDSNNFKTIKQCYRCRPSDPSACRYNDVKGILPLTPQPTPEVAVPLGPPRCPKDACPDGYVCKLLWNGSPVCCNAEKEAQLEVVYDATCPNLELAYFVEDGNPVIGDSCSSLICPKGFECHQDNPLVARCCAVPVTPTCEGPKDTGDCSLNVVDSRYYWNPTNHLCMQFQYTGCGGNGNNHHTVAECLRRCRAADGLDCYGKSRPPLNTTDLGDGRPRCNATDCGPGYKCKLTFLPEPICCEEQEEVWADDVWSEKCPGGRPALELKGLNHPLVAAECGDLSCPDGYTCVQLNKKYAKCCAVVFDWALESKPQVLYKSPVSIRLDHPCKGESDAGEVCLNGLPPVPKWYWNEEKRTCLLFNYKGCSGSSNNYVSHQACSNRCRPEDGPTCSSDDVAAPVFNVTVLASTDNASAGVILAPPAPPGADCDTPGASCPAGYSCWRGAFFSSCCNDTVSQWFDEAYSFECSNGKEAAAIYTGETYTTVLGDNCANMTCPDGFECTVVNHLFAKCCGAPPKPDVLASVDGEPTTCQTPCGKGCYPVYSLKGCPKCHCPKEPVKLERYQINPCKYVQCPMYCDVVVNSKSQCTECLCGSDDSKVVYPVSFPLLTNTTMPLFACMDFDTFVEYKLFDSERDGVLYVKPKPVGRGNRAWIDLEVRREKYTKPIADCGQNEVLTECSGHCESKCETLGQPQPCTANCSPTQCACKTNHSRNVHGVCVPTDRCNAAATDDVCSDKPCPTGERCAPLDQQCSSAPCPQFECLPAKNETQCGQNEVWNECSGHCESTCETLGQPPICTKNCSPPKCACQTNHSRNVHGVCVPTDRCTAVAQDVCSDKPCPGDKKCVPRNRQCFRAPCYQFDCLEKNSTETKYQAQVKVIPGCSCMDYQHPIVIKHLPGVAGWDWDGGDIGTARDLLLNANLSAPDKTPIDDSNIPNEADIVVTRKDGTVKTIRAKLSNRYNIINSEPYQCYRFTRADMIVDVQPSK